MAFLEEIIQEALSQDLDQQGWRSQVNRVRLFRIQDQDGWKGTLGLSGWLAFQQDQIDESKMFIFTLSS